MKEHLIDMVVVVLAIIVATIVMKKLLPTLSNWESDAVTV